MTKENEYYRILRFLHEEMKAAGEDIEHVGLAAALSWLRQQDSVNFLYIVLRLGEQLVQLESELEAVRFISQQYASRLRPEDFDLLKGC